MIKAYGGKAKQGSCNNNRPLGQFCYLLELSWAKHEQQVNTTTGSHDYFVFMKHCLNSKGREGGQSTTATMDSR